MDELTAYQLVFTPPPRPPSASPAAAAPTASPAPASSTLTSAPQGALASPTAATPSAPSATVPAVADDQERRVEVVTPDVTVAFNNRGARIISWKLAHFGDAAGRPEELVQTIKDVPHPFDMETSDTEVDARLGL